MSESSPNRGAVPERGAVPPAGMMPEHGVMIVLAYLWLLALVPLLVEKDNPEIQWHAKHGIVLMVAELVGLFAYIMATSVLSLATYAFGLGCVLSLLLIFAWIAVIGLHIVAIVKGLNGRRLIIPGISQYADRF